MIGTRAALSGTAAVLGLGLVLGPRLPDPGARLLAERLIVERAGVAGRTLDDLHAALVPGLDAARAAAAAVVSSTDPPGPQLLAAARIVREAEEGSSVAREAVAALAAAASTLHRPMPPPALRLATGELAAIADQLAAVADPADAFSQLRLAATALPAILGDALGAIDRGAFDEAASLVAEARTDLDAVAAWEDPPSTLQVWTAATGAMIMGVEAILDATRTGDAAARVRADEAFASLADEAASADRALRIAIGEAGSALTVAPVARLGEALAEVEAARNAVADMARTSGG